MAQVGSHKSIIISQGSGANVTIPPGDTKAVYLNGAGSGAAVVDAFASLSVVDLKVQDDLTVTDDVAIGGLATVGGTLGVTGKITADAGIDIDNINIDGTTIALSSGDLTLDVAGDIILDADGGDIILKDGGTQFGTIVAETGGLGISSAIVQDSDIIFKGNDGGATITALTLDMSDAGSATFSHNVKLPDNGVVALGAGSDLSLSSNGTNGNISAPNGTLTIDVAGDITLDAGGQNIIFKDDGTEFGQIYQSSNHLHIFSSINNADLKIQGNDGGATITAIELDMSDAGSAYFNNTVYIPQYLTHTGNTDTNLEFGTDTIALRAGNVKGISVKADEVVVNDGSADLDFRVESNGNANAFVVNAGSENVVFGNADATGTGNGSHVHIGTGNAHFVVNNTRSDAASSLIFLNRQGSDGTLMTFLKANSAIGNIGSASSKLHIASVGNSGIRFRDDLNCFTPCNADGSNSDNDQNIGQAGVRYTQIFATNASINTSDRTEKQDIEELTDAEKRVAVVAKGLMRKYRWKDAVALKR